MLPARRLIEAEARALRLGVKPYLLHRTRWQANQDLSGVYRFVLRIASPEMVLKAPAAHRDADVRLRLAPRNRIRRTQTGRGADRQHSHAVAEWLGTSFGVYIEAALRLAGAEGTAVEARRLTSEPRQHDVPMVTLGFNVRWR